MRRLQDLAPPLVLAMALLAGCNDASYPPPVTRVDPVTDSIHGIAFVDPYRWLEDQDAPETRAWIAEQNAYTERVVGPSPLRDSIAARYRELVDEGESVDAPPVTDDGADPPRPQPPPASAGLSSSLASTKSRRCCARAVAAR